MSLKIIPRDCRRAFWKINKLKTQRDTARQELETERAEKEALKQQLDELNAQQGAESSQPRETRFDAISDAIVSFIDPITRKKSRSKQLEYEPGVMDAIKISHWTGVVDRLLAAAGKVEYPMPQGTIKTVPLKRQKGEDIQKKLDRAEGLQMLDEGRKEAALFDETRSRKDKKGNTKTTTTTKVAFIPESSQKKMTDYERLLKTFGVNVKPFPTQRYQEAIEED